jgi:hypothetical protein
MRIIADFEKGREEISHKGIIEVLDVGMFYRTIWKKRKNGNNVIEVNN